MIIVCPECSTKFNVNADRIPDGGAKVRCARCKHVFYAEKAPDVQNVEPAFEDSLAAADSEQEIPPETETETPLSEKGGSEFSYDKFQELDSAQEDDDAFAFDADSADEDFSFTAPTTEAISPIEKVFASEEPVEEAEAELPEATSADVAEAFAPKTEESAESDFPSQAAAVKKSSPFSSIIRILLLLILALLVIGGVLVYINGPDQLNQTIQQLLGQQTDRPVQTGQISLENLEGKFVQNEQSGELFLIRGEAINNYSEPRAAIQVKGVIFDPNGKPLLQKTVFCGNPISEDELQALSFAELEKIMGNQFGQELSNMKVNEGQRIPFDIVFKDLPKNLSEFSVKVTASKPASK